MDIVSFVLFLLLAIVWLSCLTDPPDDHLR